MKKYLILDMGRVLVEPTTGDWLITPTFLDNIDSKRIDKVNDYVQKNFPYGYRHKANPQTKRSVFEAISVGVWLAINEETALTDLDKGTIQKVLSSKEFKQYTHSANETHRKQNLQGRIQTIYQLVTQTSRMINDINI